MAPTGSSSFSLSKPRIENTTSTPPTPPIRVACRAVGVSGSAVIATRPARAPLRAMVRSALTNRMRATISAAIRPPAAAMLVLTNTLATALASSMVLIFSCEPPLKPNQPIHRMKVPSAAIGRVGPGNGVDLAIRAVLAFTCAEQQYASQGSSSASHVHYARTGEVEEASFVKEARTQFPEALYWVDETGNDHGERQEGEQLHALSYGTGNDRHAGRGEHHLEEEVRTSGVVRRIVTAGQNRLNAVFFTQQETQAWQDAAFRAGVHDVVADHQVHDTRHCVQSDVLGENFSGVLGSHQTGFEHCKTRCHPHYQGAANQKVEGIKTVLQCSQCCVVHGSPLAVALFSAIRLRRPGLAPDALRVLTGCSRARYAGRDRDRWSLPLR